MHKLKAIWSRIPRVSKRARWQDQPRRIRPLLEALEARLLLATSDFGDAPLPYPTLLAERGAEHFAVGPTLGANRDKEDNGVHSAAANKDDTTGSPDDEDGVTLGTIRAGQLAATATVNVAGGSAKLDAWIDFNGDGAWGGPLEQIANRANVVPGNNTITFDVPSWAADGQTYARFRLSTAGNLGVGGAAADGEVEDHDVKVVPPKAACGCFSAHTISTAASGAWSVYAADVDGDGDTDVLSASLADNKIAWYENNGGQNFTAHIISTAAITPFSVFAADVDGDGNTDVLSASLTDDKIAWYKNDGNQNFTTHTISTAADGAFSVFAADVDGDGDTDVLSASLNDDKIAWYKNDGSQNFTAHTISTTADAATSVYAADVDGDGDTDVLSASAVDGKIAWYKNDGSQNFTAHTITTAASGAYSVFAADVDGDGDTDVLSAAFFDDEIAWYENNGSQNFTPHNISTTANGAAGVFAADVDGDGDTDVLAALALDDKIAWYENDGNQTFTAHTISTAADGAETVFAADVDGDGDLDVLSASLNDNKIAWYENANRVKFGGLQNDPVTPTIPPLPLPPPPGPIGQPRPFGAATVRERSAPPLPNGRASDGIASMAEAQDAVFIDSSFHAEVTPQRGLRTSVIKSPSAWEWTVATPDTLRLLDDVFAAGVR